MSYTSSLDTFLSKSDEQLAEIVRLGASKECERDPAFQILRERYDAELRKIGFAQLPPAWVEDMLQETWIAIYKIIRVEKLRGKFSHLLRNIAAKKRMDVLRKIDTEQRFFSDSESFDFQAAPEPERYDQEWSLNQFASLAPFIAPKLSDCQRVAYILRRVLNYGRNPIGRLMGTNPQVISQSSGVAEHRIEEYAKSSEHDIDQELLKWLDFGTYFPYRPMGLTLERNDHCISPQFTDEELRPLGLTVVEFEKHYRASLVIPQNYDFDQSSIRHLYLVFSRKKSPTLQELMARYEKKWRESEAEQSSVTQFFNLNVPVEYVRLIPEEYLIRVDIEGDHLVLTPKYAIDFIPHHLSVPNEKLTSFFDKTNVRVAFPLTVHSSIGNFTRVQLPVSLQIEGGFFIQGRQDAQNGVDLLEDYWGKSKTTMSPNDAAHTKRFEEFFYHRSSL